MKPRELIAALERLGYKLGYMDKRPMPGCDEIVTFQLVPTSLMEAEHVFQEAFEICSGDD